MPAPVPGRRGIGGISLPAHSVQTWQIAVDHFFSATEPCQVRLGCSLMSNNPDLLGSSSGALPGLFLGVFGAFISLQFKV